MTDNERLESIKTKSGVLVTLADDVGTGTANLLTVANDMNWLIGRVQELEIDLNICNATKLSMDSVTRFTNQIKDENKKLRDQLNYVKKLVQSKRAAHMIKFDLQMMFREGDE